MNKLDLLKMAASNLWRRKLRTVLTILGVIIGTASIVVMMSLGFGMRASQEEMFSQFGDVTVINVYPGMGGGSGMGMATDSGSSRTKKLDKATLGDLKTMNNVVAVSPIISSYGSLKSGRLEGYGNIIGMDTSTMEDFGYEVSEGRLLTSSDRMTRSIPVVVGAELAHGFHNPKSRVYREEEVDLMNDRIELSFDNYDPNSGQDKKDTYSLNIVGVIAGKDYESSNGIFMPFEDLEKIQRASESSGPTSGQKKSKKAYENVKIKVNSRDNVTPIQEAIKEMGFEAFSMQETIETFEKSTLVMQAVLGGIGSISLLVAAIGITNTMIMSIYERTKEIGIMKVIGASIGDIKQLFLVEAAYIGFFGGIFGLSISYLISYFLNKFSNILGASMGGEMSKISIIPPYLAILAVVFSVGIGLTAGYFPAKKAMNLSALEAIRTE